MIQFFPQIIGSINQYLHFDQSYELNKQIVLKTLYSAFHQETASQVRDRKIESIKRAGAPEVASANPGCLLHLRSAGVEVRHPLEIIDSIMTKDG